MMVRLWLVVESVDGSCWFCWCGIVFVVLIVNREEIWIGGTSQAELLDKIGLWR